MPKKRKNRINPLNSRHLDRLQTAVFDSRRQLEPFRQNRIDAIREMIGQNYSDEGTADRVPVNFIEMAVNTYARQLVANNPKVLITTKHRTLKPEAHLREVVVNNLIKEMHLAEVLYEGVIEALFCMGIVKTGVVVHDVIEIAERFHDLTQPFCDVVNLDDWVHDMSCRTYEAAQYSGNRYRLPLEMAKEMEIFDKKEREKLVELEERRVNEQGDERSETLSQGDHQYTEEYKAHCEFWDIWLPQENMLLTFPGDTSDGMTIGDKPLRTVEWDGPEDGPYHLLRFGRVPGNMMPLAPVMTWKDLAYIGTKLFNKMTNQAERQKTLGFFQEGKSKTAERIKDAIDGEVLPVENPEGVVERRFGGIDQINSAFFLQCKELFSYIAGNLDLMSGTAPQSGTLGQDQLLAKASSQRMAHMQEQVVIWTEGICRTVAWYELTDPLLDRSVNIELGNTGMELTDSLTAETIEGDWLDFNFTITPYSMHPKSPGERVQAMQVVFQQFIAPFAQLLEKEGITINFEQMLRTIARLMDMEELEDMLIFGSPSLEEAMEGAANQGKSARGNSRDRAPMPQNSSRQYEHVSTPGASRGGNDKIMQMIMNGRNPQESERNAIGRMTG